MVSYNGSAYICILPSTGNLPTNTTYWNLMVQAGSNGTNGTLQPSDQQNNTYTYEVDSGSANAYVITPSPALTAYAAGQMFEVKFTNPNTGASTINVSGLGNKNLTKNGATALSGGEIPAGGILQVVYDGTQFQLLGAGGVPAAISMAPDWPPASPTAYDDEFTGGSLSGIWSWQNQGSATVTLGSSYGMLYLPPASGDNQRGIFQTSLPATPWAFTAKLSMGITYANYALAGMALSDGTKIVTFGFGTNGSSGLVVATQTSLTSGFSFVAGPFSAPVPAIVYLQILNDGTNLTYSISPSGVPGSFIAIYVAGRTAFFSSGPTKIGLSGESNNSTWPIYLGCDWFRRTT